MLLSHFSKNFALSLSLSLSPYFFGLWLGLEKVLGGVCAEVSGKGVGVADGCGVEGKKWK